MTNVYYNNDSNIQPNTNARAQDVTAELDAIAVGFDLLPTENNLKRGKTVYAVDTGAADVYVIALANVPTSYEDGMQIAFKAANANTGASTINVNALGALPIKRFDGAALLATDIAAGAMIECRHNSTHFIMMSQHGGEAASGAASAAAAAASASAASTSETNAATSETNAASSASAASTSETNAATSETNAATSETNAATSETNAATSETNAASSASAASTSETNAASSASAASTSETNAASSETNAASSASAASTSETNAATSETNAATSETNAATSATDAAASAASLDLSEPDPIGDVTPNTVDATTLTAVLALIAEMRQEVNDKGTNSSTGTVTFDASAGNEQRITIGTSASITFDFAFDTTTDVSQRLFVEAINPGVKISLPSDVLWGIGDGTFDTDFSALGVTLNDPGSNFFEVWTTEGSGQKYGLVV